MLILMSLTTTLGLLLSIHALGHSLSSLAPKAVEWTVQSVLVDAGPVLEDSMNLCGLSVIYFDAVLLLEACEWMAQFGWQAGHSRINLIRCTFSHCWRFGFGGP